MWPSQTRFSRRALAALAIAGALLTAGCGDGDGASAGGSQAAGNRTDRAFVADMIAHHEAAVQMAQIARRRGTSAFVKQLAGDIVTTQNAEISTMRAADRRLAAAGIAKGSLGLSEQMMGMDHDTAVLATAAPFDPAFLRMMLPHHEGALTMAELEIAKGGDGELKRLAQAIITAQQREIAEMRDHLGEQPGAGEHTADEMHGG